MTVTPMRPNNEAYIGAMTASIATTPVAGYAVVPRAGLVQRVMASSAGTTTGTITVAVKINGGSTDIANSALTIAAGSGNVATTVELALQGSGSTSGVFVNEGDLVSFTPSGGTGSSIAGAFGLVVRCI